MPTKAVNEFDRILDQALTTGAPVVDAGEDMTALLQTALAVRQALEPGLPGPAFAANAEKRILNVLRSRQRQQRSKPAGRKLRLGWLRLAPALVSAVLVATLALGSVGVAAASASALPGDGALYQIKRGLERAQLAFTFSEAAELELLADFADARLAEIESLTDLGRNQDLELAVSGYIEAVDQLSEGVLSGDSVNPTLQSGLDEQLSHHIQVLQTVQEKVPPQAQGALERAIDRSSSQSDKPGSRNVPPGQHNDPPGQQPDAGEQGQSQRDQAEQAQIQRRAEQMARQYDVSVDEILQLLNGACAGDWKCVRDVYQPRGPK